jgi:acyl transferase domain-containing protein
VLRRTTAIALVALALVLGACSSSSDDDAATTTDPTTAEPTAEPGSEATTTEADEATTTEPEATTSTTAASEPTEGLPSCQELLQQYTDAFTPDDLAPVVERFRAWAPDMPAEVGAAVTRLADAYDEAGDLGNLNMADVDLTADAQTFSDWTNEGCPPA